MKPERFGIGATIGKRDATGVFFVKNCLVGGPADRGGLRAGDEIVEFDGRPIMSWSLDSVLQYIVRDEPLPLGVTVGRNGQIVSVLLVRERYSAMLARAGLKMEEGARVSAIDDVAPAKVGETVLLQPLHGVECDVSGPDAREAEYQLIYFWASWCSPCKALIERLRGKRTDGTNVRLVGANVDADCETFSAAVRSVAPPGSQYWTGGWYSETARLFGVERRGIPLSALLDRSGRLLRVSVGLDSTMSMLDGALQ